MNTYSPNFICSNFILLLAASLSGCSGSAGSSETAAAAQLSLSATASVGQLLFNDPALSASGKQSCANCHAAGSAFTAGNNAPVQLGGVALTLQGVRNTPTAMYASFIPGFVLNAPRPPNAPAGSASQLNPRGGTCMTGVWPTWPSRHTSQIKILYVEGMDCSPNSIESDLFNQQNTLGVFHKNIACEINVMTNKINFLMILIEIIIDYVPDY